MIKNVVSKTNNVAKDTLHLKEVPEDMILKTYVQILQYKKRFFMTLNVYVFLKHTLERLPNRESI